MKRILTMITIAAFMICMCMPIAVFADDHGADAHSPSMSAESGEEPIADESTTLEGGGNVVDELVEDDGEVLPEDEDADEEEEEPKEEGGTKVLEMDEEGVGEGVEPTYDIAKILYVAAGSAVGLALLIVIIAIVRGHKRRKARKAEKAKASQPKKAPEKKAPEKKDTYRAKH